MSAAVKRRKLSHDATEAPHVTKKAPKSRTTSQTARDDQDESESSPDDSSVEETINPEVATAAAAEEEEEATEQAPKSFKDLVWHAVKPIPSKYPNTG